ncbi:DNA binding domain, excisionase family, partial [Dysosmobacter welbionis]
EPVLLKDRAEPQAGKAVYGAAVRPLQPHQDTQQSGLARPGRGHEAGHLSGREHGGEITQHRFAVKGLAQ